MVFTTKRCSCEVKQTHLYLTSLEHHQQKETHNKVTHNHLIYSYII